MTRTAGLELCPSPISPRAYCPGTHCFRRLQSSWGQRITAAPALAAEVGRGGGRVIDVGQPILVSALLLGPVRGTAVSRWRSK